jgi:hypothetical protein
MADNDEQNGSATADGGSDNGDAGEQDPTAKLIEDYRKRQAGADRAAAIATEQRDAALRELEALKQGKRSTSKSDDSNGQVDVEALKAELRAEFGEATEKAVAAERGKALDRIYPAARKKFPSLTDEAQLAELEEVFGDRPAPVGNNQSRQNDQKNIADMSVAELKKLADTQLEQLLRKD